MKISLQKLRATTLATSLALISPFAWSQQAPAPSATAGAARPAAPGTTTSAVEEVVIQLSPFEVSGKAETGYGAATTLAGNRLNTDLRDLGNSVSVITSQFLKDIGATNNETLLQYTLGTEVGNIQGNFAGVGDSATLNESSRFTNPNQNTRVRGLTSADNTRDYFLTDIPWDGFAVDRVDLQRGPNSILFGQGSPAGIINTGTKQAGFKNAHEAEIRFDGFGTIRSQLDLNRVILKDQLAVRVIGLNDEEKFKQKPAFDNDRRLFAATRWEPAFLKKTDARTIVKANIEWGEVSSNRPRSLPPIDMITPWFLSGTYQGRNLDGTARTFSNLNRETFNPFQLQDDNTGRPNHGQQRPSINGGPNAGKPNPAYNPWIGSFAQSFGGPLAYFSGSGAPSYWVQENRTTRGIGPTGAIDGNISFGFHRPGGLATQAQFARNARLPFSEFGVYRNNNLTDRSVFNFYENLIDGPNKSEWQNFRTYNVSLAQTFLRDKIGFELTYNKEDYKNGQLALLSDSRQALYVDLNNVYSDGTAAGKDGEPYEDGTPNPNVGRAFVSDSGQFGNNSYMSERESGRATVFGTHNFARQGESNWINRLLGRHTVTGLYSQDRQKTDRRSWQRYAILDPAYRTFIGAPAATKFTDNLLAVNPVIYLGPSLLSRNTAAGASLPRIGETITVSSATVRAFDSTWAARPGVDPATVWMNEYFPAGHASRQSTQAENPANYIGFRDVPFTVTDSEAAPGNRDALTTSARLTKSRVFSRVAVWQGHFWNNAVVGTYGIRKDVAKAWSISRDSNGSPGFGQVNLGETFRLPDKPNNILEVTSKSWSIVTHLNRFIGDKLPVRVSLFYNKSENFQPAASRVDFYGEPIGAPQGNTVDKGVLLETRDGRFSLRVNKYETAAKNASSNGLGGAWFLGTSQAWSGNWANVFEFDLGNQTLDTAGRGSSGRYTYSPGPGENQDQANARESAAVAAWRAWQKQIDPRFYKAWGVQYDPGASPGSQVRNLGASTPNGFALTEDSFSQGYEIELNAQATKSWRLTFNAAKTDATRSNIGGAALADFVSKYETALKTTAAGDLRIWWGGAGNETSLFQWNANVGSEFTSRKLQEGTNVPELREWRFNAISNYDFSEGFLKGVNLGAGLRWQDTIIIGYQPLPGATASDVSFDIANPYRGPAETNIDLWVGYGRRQIWRGVDWRIQLNVRNVGQQNALIPITTQPDGTPAGFRIAPVQTWSISNIFKF
ncbi:MAG: TonB-dependent receptor plug domain-containing protein [Planctomycetaceae bacterium]|nr:TonB-dependent receptor plug domain-containing protein [Planctomycetaceae bacterium]